MTSNTYRRYYETFDFNEGRRFPEEDAILQLNNDLFHLVDDVVALHDKAKQFLSYPVTNWRNCYRLSLLLLDAKTLESQLVSNFTKLEQYWFYYRNRVNPGRRESFVQFFETTGSSVSFDSVTGLVRAHWMNLKNLSAKMKNVLPEEDEKLPDSQQQEIQTTFQLLQQKMEELEQTALFLQRHSAGDMRRLEGRIENLENEFNSAQRLTRAGKTQRSEKDGNAQSGQMDGCAGQANANVCGGKPSVPVHVLPEQQENQPLRHNKRIWCKNISDSFHEEPVNKSKNRNLEETKSSGEKIIFKVSTKPSKILDINNNDIQSSAVKPLSSLPVLKSTVIFIPENGESKK